MISLEQINRLEIRVKKAVGVIKALNAENTVLKQQVTELEANLDNLKQEASSRKADEERLEVSLQGVLDVLDEMDENENEQSFEATIVQTDESDLYASDAGSNTDKDDPDKNSDIGSETPVSEDSDSTNVGREDENDENEILAEPDDVVDPDEARNGENAAADDTGGNTGESSLDTIDDTSIDDTPEEINLDESSNGDIDDENIEEAGRSNRVQSEFDIF